MAGIIWARRSGAQPEVPIEAGGAGAVRLRGPPAAALQVEDLHELDLSQLAAANVVAGGHVVWRAAVLGADLEDAVVLAGGVDHLPSLPYAQRHVLLDVNVLARLASPD